MIGGVSLVSISSMISNETSASSISSPLSDSSLETSTSLPALTAFPKVRSINLPFVDVKITSVLLFAQSKKLIGHAIFVLFELV